MFSGELIGGTHLGGEGSVKYSSDRQSIKLDLKIFDFLSTLDNIHKALKDGYLQKSFNDTKGNSVGTKNCSLTVLGRQTYFDKASLNETLVYINI